MGVKLGINPITWTHDDVPILGGDTPLEVCLSETRQAGYRGTELGGKFPSDSAVLGTILKSFDLELVSGWFDGRILEREVEAEFEALQSHLSLLRDLGCSVVVYADTSWGRHDAIFRPISERPHLNDAWPAYGRKITALAERMAEFGVRMAFHHHHMGMTVETDAEIGALMHHTGDAVGLLFDTGHCAFAGASPAALLAEHVDRVVHVHCKDVRAEVLASCSTDMSFMGAVMEGIFPCRGMGGPLSGAAANPRRKWLCRMARCRS